MRKLFTLGLVAALALTAACSGSDTPSSPMAPSVMAMPTSPTGPTSGPTSGAMLTGTVTVASGAKRVTPSATGGLTISVAGTNLSAPVDGNGSFTLDGVPPGDVQITISGGGVNATLTVGGVQAGQTIKLKITVSGTSGSIDSDERDDDDADDEDGQDTRELEGRIESVLSASSLMVSGQVVTTTSSTVIRKGDATILFSELVVGLRVHVKGTMDSTTTPATLAATEIKVQNENTTVPMKVEGVVAAAPTGTCPEITFVLQGSNITVKTDSRTNFRSRCSDVGLGDTVEVMGRLLVVSAPAEDAPPPGSTILADKIEITKAAPDAPPVGSSPELEFKGAMSGLGGSCPAISFMVGTQPIVANSSTSFKPSCAALKNGDSVEVKGALQADGKVLATKIARE